MAYNPRWRILDAAAKAHRRSLKVLVHSSPSPCAHLCHAVGGVSLLSILESHNLPALLISTMAVLFCCIAGLLLLGSSGGMPVGASEFLISREPLDKRDNTSGQSNVLLTAAEPFGSTAVSVPSCSVGQSSTPVTVTVGEYTLEAQFQCTGEADPAKFAPDCTQHENTSQSCCAQESCENPPTIAHIWG